MTTKTEYLVYFSLGLVLLVFLGFASLLGPVGWVAGIFLLVGVYLLANWSGLFSDPGRSADPAKVSCSACGARTASKERSCSYCGAEL